MYTGIFTLKDILPEDKYNHFLLFSISIRILSSDKFLMIYSDYAQICLERFVKLSEELYGQESQILNMHSLSHLVDDIKKFKCSLSKISAFDFENSLGILRKYLRSGNKPLEQLCRRLNQNYTFKEDEIKKPSLSKILKFKKVKGQVLIYRIQFKNYLLTTKEPKNF